MDQPDPAAADAPLTLAAIVAEGRRLMAQAGTGGQRIAIAGSAATGLLACAIACAVAQEREQPCIHEAPFGAYVQEVLDLRSALHRFRPDLVVLAPDWQALPQDIAADAPAAAAQAWVEAQAALFRRLWDVIADRMGARIVQHALAPPVRRWRGLADRLAPAGAAARAAALNHHLFAAAAGRVQFVELDRLAAEAGALAWSGERFQAAARMPFDPRFLPDYVPAFRAAWRGAMGRAKKVLALDLDNTLWGGVIGDDGPEGIVLGPGSAAGEAFAAWQAYLRELSGRGVILAACSRNDPAIAAEAFAHPHSALRREDFVAFECSWGDKPAGLGRIAAALNVGLDAIVLADDNPAECALVRAALPQVETVALGADPAQFPARLDRGGWFDLAQYTAEDRSRTAAYAARAQAEAARADTADVAAFLRGLRMTGSVFRPGAADAARIAQLEQKTNQFNLTGRRYDEAAVRALLDDPAAELLALRLSDRFGDHGLVSSLIARAEDGALRIDSWVMSCRVFARTAEAFMLRALLDAARARGLRRIVGEYCPTARNGVVSGLFAGLGFVAAGSMWERGLQAAPETAIAALPPAG